MKKITVLLTAIFLLMGVVPMNAFADESDVIGGVVQLEGDVSATFVEVDGKVMKVSNEELSLSVVSTRASSPIWGHNGNSQYCSQHSSTECEVAHGETTCYIGTKGVYHYTRAQMQTRKGKVLEDSQRQWGTGYSEATSPCAHYVHKAKTYYGK